MRNELIIRRATSRDAQVIADFNRAMAWETEQKELARETILSGVRNLIANPQLGFYIVAELDQQPVACLLITYEWSDWRDGLFWWIQSVYVLPDYRCRGIYTQMYAFIKAWARQQPNVCGLRLYVAETNDRAQATYRQLGMQATHYRLFEEIIR